jgi:type II secretory pathway pseudopilin PulG
MEAPHCGTYRRAMCNRNAHTLTELALVLMILGTLAAIAAPSLARGRDVYAVRAARSELAGAIAVTRAAAIRNGGAAFVFDAGSGTGWIVTARGSRLPGTFVTGPRYGVRITSDRAPPVEFRFDALGIGRLANGVLRVQRGRAEATLTISAYGRVRT